MGQVIAREGGTGKGRNDNGKATERQRESNRGPAMALEKLKGIH